MIQNTILMNITQKVLNISRLPWLVIQYNGNVIAYPLLKGKFVLDIYASDFEIIEVLSHEKDGSERFIDYFSKGLSTPESNYCVTIVKSKEFYKYLYGPKFLLRTGHVVSL